MTKFNLCPICRSEYLVEFEEVSQSKILICKKCFILINESHNDDIEFQSQFQLDDSFVDHGTMEEVSNAMKSMGVLFEYLFSIKQPSGYSNFLDFGTGRGYIAFAASLLGFDNVYAKDFHEHLFSCYKTKCEELYPSVSNVTFVKEIPDITFDYITLWHVLEHVPDPCLFLLNIKRFTRKGTLIALQTPQLQTRYVEQSHKFFFNKLSMLSLMNIVDLSIIHISYDPTFDFMTTVVECR